MSTPASARLERSVTAAPSGPGRVSVVKVSGLLDPILVDFIEGSIAAAERTGAVAVVLQLNSSGSVVSAARIATLARRVHDSRVPVAVWVGPSGARALGAAAQVAGAADRIGVAPGSRIGRTGDIVVPRGLLQPAFTKVLGRIESGTLGSGEALRTRVAVRPAPVIGEFIIGLPGVKTRVVRVNGRPRRQTVSIPVFSALPVQDQLLHNVASPASAYLFFVIGMALIVFELFTAGVGVAGLVGAGCFLLGCYGFSVLPTSVLGIALLVAAMIGFAIDVQTGVPRVWTAVGATCLTIGSLLIYNGLDLSWITLLVGIAGISLFMLAGMPAMVRTRFSTPTIGREWMIGETGEAVAAVNPEGVIRIKGALWRARTNRATPITAGATVRVVEVEGLLLEVEPEEGGARDHRERRSRT
jgi:membrane-bound serine protease (ClpP class)